MLTELQLTKLYADGVTIVYRRNNPRELKGEFDPGTLEATVYLPTESPEDRHMTIFHELIHARDGKKDLRIMEARLDDDVEREAQQTYEKRPELINFIKELWELPY